MTIWVVATLALLPMGGASALAQSLGQEWVALTESEGRILFDAPGLDQRVSRRMRMADPGHAYTAEVATWMSTQAPYPLAMIMLYELSPNLYLKRLDEPRQFIQRIPAFRKIKVRFGERSKVTNSVGRASVHLFEADEFRCAAFVQAPRLGDRESHGGIAIQGYYCADLTSALTDPALADVVRGVKIRSPQ